MKSAVPSGVASHAGGKRCRCQRIRTSLLWLAHQIGPIIRSHWAIENSPHRVMDMIFRDDECRLRKDHAPANFTTLKHMAHNLVRKALGKDYLRLRRRVAAWDDDFLASLIAA